MGPTRAARTSVVCMAVTAIAAVAMACHPQPAPPNPPTPDASDAATYGDATPDASAPLACIAACKTLNRLGCEVLADCATTLGEHLAPTAHMIRNARSGHWLTCEDVAGAATSADLQAMGQPCGVH